MHTLTRSVLVAAAAAGLLASAAATNPSAVNAAPADGRGYTKFDSLAASAPKDLKIGGLAAGGGHHMDADYPDPFTYDEDYRALLAKEFSSLTPENQMKWDHIHPAKDTYDFEAADAIVDFAQEHGQDVRGHALFWHSQNPEWLTDGDFTKDELREILHDHVTTVVGHYKGKIDQWDVANEIFKDDGTLRTEENIWIRELGPEIIGDVFTWAHEADPEADLFFNDYNVEGLNAKANAYYTLIQQLLEQGVPVDGMGFQTHLGTMYGYDTTQPENLKRFGDLGLKTAITELDVRSDTTQGEPTQEIKDKADEYYSNVLEACLGEDSCTSFTIWGASDEYSWVPATFEGEGYATPWTEDLDRKSSYCTLQKGLTESNHGGENRFAKNPAYQECRDILS